MSVGALLPKLILFSIPLALSNVLQIAFNMADLIVAGRYVGDRALAAVGSNASLVSLLVCLIGGLTLGVGVLVSRFYGAKDDAALRETVRTSFATIAIGSAIFGALGAVFSVPILRMRKRRTKLSPWRRSICEFISPVFPRWRCTTARRRFCERSATRGGLFII